jgi:hypothetical protein
MESRHWVCRIDKKPCDRYGQFYIPYGDGYITWTSPLFWKSFSQVVAAYEQSVAEKGKISGIGFIIARDPSRRRDRQVIGLDLDACRDPLTGWTSPWAESILKQLDSPTGVSISETGFRVFCLGKLPEGLSSIQGHGPDDITPEAKVHILSKKPKSFNGLEIYSDGPRHLSVSGIWLDEYPPELDKRSRELAEIAAPFLVRPQVITPPKTAFGRLLANDGMTSTGECGQMMPLDEFRRRVDILDVIDTAGFHQEGQQLFGPHPIFGSTTGRNLVVDPVKGIWISFHNGIRWGGTVIDWLACESGAIAWEEAGAGSLAGNRAAIHQTLQYAVERGLIDEDAAFSDRSEAV